MELLDQLAEVVETASQTIALNDWMSVLAALSFLAYLMIIFGGRGR